MDLLFYIGIGVFSSWLIAKACDGFETAADYLGRNMGEGTKGATINAIGSSMPELWVTVIYLFIFSDTTGFAGGIGTTAGSAVFNSMVIPGLVILSVLWKTANVDIQVSRSVIVRDGTTLLAAEFFLIYFLGDTLYWYHGMFLMLIYISYASWMIYRHKSGISTNVDDNDADDDAHVEPEGNTDNDRIEDEQPAGSAFISFLKVDLEDAIIRGKKICNNNAYILLGAATTYIAVACWALVYSCEGIGVTLGIPGYFVAVIIAAAASSVPDTILSIKDAGKGNYDDAISNALGSNIFDICFALGAPLFLFTIIYGPISMAPEIAKHIVELQILLFLLTIAILIVFFSSKKMTKTTAYILIGMYLSFVLYVVGRANDVALAGSIADVLHALQGIIQ